MVDMHKSKTESLSANIGMLLICIILYNLAVLSYNSVKKSTEQLRGSGTDVSLQVTYEVNSINANINEYVLIKMCLNDVFV